MQKIAIFLQKSLDIVSQKTVASLDNFVKDIQAKQIDSNNDLPPQNKTSAQNDNKIQQNADDIIPLTVDRISLDNPLQNIQLQESKVIQLESRVFSQNQLIKEKSVVGNLKSSISSSRIKQIQDEKKRILQELKKLDGEIAQIKKQKDGSESLQKSKFHKKVQISDDLEAKKQAQSLIKQLHLQKMKMEQKRKKMQQKELQQRKREENQKKRQRQQLEKKIKQQKMLIIQKRMEEERKKREQRKMVDKQANLLICELKKEEEFQKQRDLIPGQILQYEQKKKLLQKKSIFNMNEIQNHQKKYRELKSKDKQLRRERSESIKVSRPVPKYGKNIWVQMIQEEQTRRKQEQKIKQLNKKIQLQKRIKYGDIVNNIFRSKLKKRQQSIEKLSKQTSQVGEEPPQRKPRTPDISNHLPQIRKSQQKRQNLTDKKFKERQPSESIIQNKKSRIIPKPQQVRERDPEYVEKLQRQKLRQMELRKQTKQRLKKMQNQSIDLPKPSKAKYQNYIAQVKVRKADPHEEWKRIMSNQKLSKQQKYKEMLNKAAHMQNQAKIKQDLRKSGDQDAVNLYIGSIQAKLALLQKF